MPGSAARLAGSARRGLRWRPAFGWYDLILGRALPAFVFQFFVVYKATVVIPQLQAGVASGADLLALGALAQQLFTLLFQGLLVILFIVRRPVTGRRSSFVGAAVALGGTFVLYLPVGRDAALAGPPLLAMSTLLLALGTAWSLASLACLGRCFGLLPEARGLVTRGPYRWIRHPLYLGELIEALGLAAAYPSAPTFGLYAVFCGLQYCRARLEEQALRAVFPAYAEYARRTWRILPGIH